MSRRGAGAPRSPRARPKVPRRAIGWAIVAVAVLGSGARSASTWSPRSGSTRASSAPVTTTTLSPITDGGGPSPTPGPQLAPLLRPARAVRRAARRPSRLRGPRRLAGRRPGQGRRAHVLRRVVRGRLPGHRRRAARGRRRPRARCAPDVEFLTVNTDPLAARRGARSAGGDRDAASARSPTGTSSPGPAPHARPRLERLRRLDLGLRRLQGRRAQRRALPRRPEGRSRRARLALLRREPPRRLQPPAAPRAGRRACARDRGHRRCSWRTGDGRHPCRARRCRRRRAGTGRVVPAPRRAARRGRRGRARDRRAHGPAVVPVARDERRRGERVRQRGEPGPPTVRLRRPARPTSSATSSSTARSPPQNRANPRFPAQRRRGRAAPTWTPRSPTSRASTARARPSPSRSARCSPPRRSGSPPTRQEAIGDDPVAEHGPVEREGPARP